MKKFIAIGIASVLSLTVLAGCGGNNENGNGKNNTAPVIEGVKETATVMAGEEWDALAGVTATDAEDGDLTSKIEVSAMGLTFTNGKTTPTEANFLGYEVIYSVKDKGGLEAEEFCTLVVNEAAARFVAVYEADFSDLTPKYDWEEGSEGEGNNHYWNLQKGNGAEAAATLKEGVLEVDVTNRNNAGDDQLMLTRGFDDLPVGRYKFAVWAKASADVKINMNAVLDDDSLDMAKITDEDGKEGTDNEKWAAKNLGGGKYEQQVTAEYKVFTLGFEIKEDALTEAAATANKAKVLFRVCLGGNNNPNAFRFDVEKITIWKTTGANRETDLFTLNSDGADSPANVGGFTFEDGWEGAQVAVGGYDEAEQAVKLDITKYNTKDGIWTIVAKAPLTGATLEVGKKYGVEVEMKAETEIKPEIVVGRNGSREDGKDKEPRFIKGDVAVGNGEYTTIRGEFDGFATTTPYIFFQLGKNNDTNYPAVDANVIYVKNIRLFEIKEDSTKETDIYTMDLTQKSSESGSRVEITNQGDGAKDVTVGSKEGATTVEIGTYNTDQGSWSIIATIPLTGVTIDTQKTYGYEIVIKADSAFGNAEMHCGPKANTGDGDKWYSGDIGTIGSEYRTLYHTFKFGEAYSEPALHLFLGKDPAANQATSNVVYIKSFRFFEVEGNEETSKIEDKFILFGQSSPDKTNGKYPISVYNQSDDVFDAAAMGTAYFENNKLVYLIHRGGSDWGHNKLAFGYWENPIGPLPADAYYVVSFKIKASVALDFSMTLHDMDMGWDEAEGGIPLRYADFGGHELLHAGTEEMTIEVVTPVSSLVAHNRCELLFEFGKALGENKDVKIEISDLKIGYRAVQA